MEKSKIRIFVCHSPNSQNEIIAENDLYENVMGGAYLLPKNNRCKDFSYDDEGINISSKNKFFNELTVQFWAWKNTNYDYYGLCHYRRYISFRDNFINKNIDERGFIVEDCLNQKTISDHLLDDLNKMTKIISKHDAIVLKAFSTQKVKTGCGYFKTLSDHYLATLPFLDKKIFKLVGEIIEKIAPKMYPYYKKYICGDRAFTCNCYIMKKALFNEMCEFEFKILFRLENELDMSNYSVQKMRTCGYMSEILYGTFITYLIDKKRKVCQKRCIYVHDSKKYSNSFARIKSGLSLITFSDNEDAKYLSFSINSIIHVAMKEKIKVNIVVYENGISNLNKEKLLSMLNASPYVCLKFVNYLFVYHKNLDPTKQIVSELATKSNTYFFKSGCLFGSLNCLMHHTYDGFVSTYNSNKKELINYWPYYNVVSGTIQRSKTNDYFNSFKLPLNQYLKFAKNILSIKDNIFFESLLFS